MAEQVQGEAQQGQISHETALAVIQDQGLQIANLSLQKSIVTAQLNEAQQLIAQFQGQSKPKE